MINTDAHNPRNVVFVMAGEGPFFHELTNAGYRVVRPYKDKRLFGRILRELWFRIPFLPQKAWFYQKALKRDADAIIVFDPLITQSYLLWLKATQPACKLVFFYRNMIGKAKHILPADIPEGIEIWTYDDYDARKYKLKLSRGFYVPYSAVKSAEKLYDVFFVGRDKGRSEYIFELEKQFNDIGYKTKFIVTANGRFGERKKKFSKPVPYDEVCRYLSNSKAVLNLIMADQEGITLRDYEALFFGIKLITNNPKIRQFDFFHPANIFIIENHNLAGFDEFMKTPYVPIDHEMKVQYTIDAFLKKIIG